MNAAQAAKSAAINIPTYALCDSHPKYRRDRLENCVPQFGHLTSKRTAPGTSRGEVGNSMSAISVALKSGREDRASNC
jgi:hypothetical protein